MSLELLTENAMKMTVEPADLLVSHDPDVSVFTLPLGACLGISAYDPKMKVGGIVHSLLPSSSLDPARAAGQPGMFIDTGFNALVEKLESLQASRENLRICVAGAAHIIDEAGLFNIGKLNCDFLHEFLGQLDIPIYAASLGGNTNCSMELHIGTGEVRVKYCGQPIPKSLCKPLKTT